MKLPGVVLLAVALLKGMPAAFASPEELISHSRCPGEQDAGGQAIFHENMRTETRGNLRNTVEFLAGEIGSRSYDQQDALKKAGQYISRAFESYGYDVLTQSYEARGEVYENIFVQVRGTKEPDRVLVVGAHYDTVKGTPGADDNASGIAGLLELARLSRKASFEMTVHFVAFALEEPPFFRSRQMGSYVYARRLHEEKVKVEGMICLEMIGYFTDEPESQMFPLPFFRFFYPRTGNFITLVGNLQSKEFLRRAKSAFRKGTTLPVESLTTISIVPGVDFSDHRSFWKFGYDALMVTDTAFYRNPQYHGGGDVPDILDYHRMTEVVFGLSSVIDRIAGRETSEKVITR